jgi:hypothetical protein
MFGWEPESDADPPQYLIWGVRKQSWIDRSGKRIRPVPQPRTGNADRLVPFQEDDLFGYSRGGNTVIPPRFLEADDFYEGRARVVLEGPCVPAGGGMCGGPVLLPRSAVPRSVPPLYIQSGRWRPNAPACRYTFINELGEVLAQPGFHEAAPFREGMAAFRVDKLWGYVDKNMSVVVPPRFQQAAAFSEGLAAVRDAAGFSYVDRTGSVQIPGPFENAGEFHEGLAVLYRNQRSYYIDKAGRHAVPGEYPYAGRFFHGRANVQLRDGGLAYIDRTGRIVYKWKPR